MLTRKTNQKYRGSFFSDYESNGDLYKVTFTPYVKLDI